jgi:hypothetical protein
MPKALMPTPCTEVTAMRTRPSKEIFSSPGSNVFKQKKNFILKLLPRHAGVFFIFAMMNKSKIPGLLIAFFGLIVATALLIGSIRFYHTITALTRDNPSLHTASDTLRVLANNDSLIDYNASLNQQIADKLDNKREDEMNTKQILLHNCISSFIYSMDTLQSASLTHDEKLLLLKNNVNKTNMACRAALFDVRDAGQIEMLNTFLIVDEKKLEHTMFECFTPNEIAIPCYEKIKHQALYLESIILEKNFKQLNL